MPNFENPGDFFDYFHNWLNEIQIEKGLQSFFKKQ